MTTHYIEKKIMIKEDRMEHDIIFSLLKLSNEFPRLSKYLAAIEQENTKEDKRIINLKELIPYLDSLELNLKDYRKTERGNKLNNLVMFYSIGNSIYSSGDDLDILGSELEDKQECVGSEGEMLKSIVVEE